ncbi:MAG: hypothetical protein HYS27_25765 [Deltaproteobacteria bacterium]|nr:hypothetical protein [Deltaproteobacteria bacterium]
MAKKKKNKGSADKGDAGAPASSAAVPAANVKAAPNKGGGVPTIERAFQVGNFAAVRRLATPDANEQRLLSLVKVDRGQLLVGLGALVVLLIVALLVLRLG